MPKTKVRNRREGDIIIIQVADGQLSTQIACRPQLRRCFSLPSGGVLCDAQPKNTGLDQPADIAERATTFEPASRPTCGVEAVDWRAISLLDAAVTINGDAVHRVGDAGADR